MTKPQITVRLSPSLPMELNQCAESVPLSQRVAKLAVQMKELTTLVKFGSGVKEVS